MPRFGSGFNPDPKIESDQDPKACPKCEHTEQKSPHLHAFLLNVQVEIWLEWQGHFEPLAVLLHSAKTAIRDGYRYCGPTILFSTDGSGICDGLPQTVR